MAKMHLRYTSFAETVRLKFRFIFDQPTQDFLKWVSETAKEREFILPEGSNLWRSQAEVDEKDSGELSPCAVDRLKPVPQHATEGRVNPLGILVLYLANDSYTSMAELRPWIGAKITLGTFRTTRDLRLVDCSKTNGVTHLGILTALRQMFGEDTPEITEKIREHIWSQIDTAFATPITLNPKRGEYVPTQVLAEVFRRDGYDGLIHRSSVGDGHNVVLFDLAAADVVEREVFTVTHLKHTFQPLQPRSIPLGSIADVSKLPQK